MGRDEFVALNEGIIAISATASGKFACQIVTERTLCLVS